MRGTSVVETLQEKEYHECLVTTHETGISTYRSDNEIFLEYLLEYSVQTCVPQIRYLGVGYLHQRAMVEFKIKEFNLGIQILLLQATRLWP